MFSPDASFTFQDLILRVAENVGLPYYPDQADNRAQIPVDPHNLDIVKRAINDGSDNVLRAYPHWTWASMPFEFTLYPDGDGPQNLEEDAGRYLLPWCVSGNPQDGWVYASDGISGVIVPTSRETVFAMRAADPDASGTPTMACVTAIQNPGKIKNQRQSFQVVFWPKPSQSMTVSATFRYMPRPMVELGERHPAGAIHQQTFVDAGTAAFWNRPSSDQKQAEYWQQRSDKSIAQSILLDQQNTPKNIGQFFDPSCMYDGVWRPIDSTMYLNGTAIPTA